ncbi:MAG: hypothetical protein CV087_09420 [Candidatus Brocadia sp. WS118]|nr:MAG: hypothetical protein CV087_09420 [Candidatus Brocadia sp. WS118]
MFTLKLKPDITILDPTNLSIAHSIQKYEVSNTRISYASTTGKKFEFVGKAIIIEIAFIKHDKGVTLAKDIRKIRKDFDKIQSIININDGNVKGFVVVFSKVNNCRYEFKELKREIENSGSIRFFHGTANYEYNSERNTIHRF